MAARKRAPGSTGAKTVYTLKFTPEERELVGRLVEDRARELRDSTGQDIEVTVASLLRWLLEREAQSRHLTKDGGRHK